MYYSINANKVILNDIVPYDKGLGICLLNCIEALERRNDNSIIIVRNRYFMNFAVAIILNFLVL